MLTGAMLLPSLLLFLAIAPPDGAAVYKQRCAMCHDRSAETRAPAPAALRQMAAPNIVRALESGLMKEQGAALTAADKLSVAEFLAGKVGSARANTCAASAFSISGARWNGWGADLSNTRF